MGQTTGWDPFKYEKKGRALQKCWLGFTIAKNKHEDDKLEIYARSIQKLEKQL